MTVSQTVLSGPLRMFPIIFLFSLGLFDLYFELEDRTFVGLIDREFFLFFMSIVAKCESSDSSGAIGLLVIVTNDRALNTGSPSAKSPP